MSLSVLEFGETKDLLLIPSSGQSVYKEIESASYTATHREREAPVMTLI
jgi:hypothetical protein